MANEILSVKLCELEEQLSRLSVRVHLCEKEGHEQLIQEIKALSEECAETELNLSNKLLMSKARMVSPLADTYTEIESMIRTAKSNFQTRAARRSGSEGTAEEKILLAEYALDFSALAANRALLLSMEAIDAQLTQQEGRSQ